MGWNRKRGVKLLKSLGNQVEGAKMSLFGGTSPQIIQHDDQASELLKKQRCLLLDGYILYQIVKTAQKRPFQNLNLKK